MNPGRLLIIFLILPAVICWTYPDKVRKRLEIDVRPESMWIEGCLSPAFRAAGWDHWSRDFIQGFRGLAFVFNMPKSTGSVWHRENYMYGDMTLEMLKHLGDSFESFCVLPADQDVNHAKNLAQTRKRAWDAVRAALDMGLPAVVLDPISSEMANEFPNPRLMRIPSYWSLIVGYDELAETYVVDSEASGGRLSVRWDDFGNHDRSRTFCIMIIKPGTKSLNVHEIHRATIKRALDISQGLYPGNTGKGTLHGLAAWQTWLDAFLAGNVSVDNVQHHASFIKLSRGWAITYLKAVEIHFSGNARVFLREAVKHYEAICKMMDELIAVKNTDPSGAQIGAEILTRAFEHEHLALDSLRAVLAAL